MIVPSAVDQLATLFDLGRRVMSVLDLDELLERIPDLIARVVSFDAFAVYLLDRRAATLRVAYAVGYPQGAVGSTVLRVGEGLVGTAVSEKLPVLANELTSDARYVPIAPGMQSELVAPLILKGRAIGALNILSRKAQAFSEADVALLSQFGAHVAVALENARLFERERRDAEVFETLAEIGREVSAILDPDELLTRLVELAKRLIDYRTFGILLLKEDTGELEMKIGLQYGERVQLPRVKIGDGLVGYAALHKVAVVAPDVSQDPRYIKVVEDVRSEMAVPILYHDRCIGVFDVESPELSAFDKRDVEILTLLASHAAVAIENARLYEALRANEARLEKELRFAQRVQTSLLPTRLPKRLRGVDVAAKFSPAREVGGDFYDFLSPESHGLVVAVGDVSGKGVPAALYSAAAGELVRSRTFRRRYTSERTTPAAILATMNTILRERQLEEYFCTLCYASFDLKQRRVMIANSGLPYPIRSTGDECAQIQLAGVPLGAIEGSVYEEVTLPLAPGDVFVFCTDGVHEAANASGEEFGVDRLIEVVRTHRHQPAAAIVDAIVDAVAAFEGEAPQTDDLTTVAVKITLK